MAKRRDPRDMTPDRIRQVETMRRRYGEKHYENIGAKSSTFAKRPDIAMLASWRHWKPERFMEDGSLKSEWQDEFDKVVDAKSKSRGEPSVTNH